MMRVIFSGERNPFAGWKGRTAALLFSVPFSVSLVIGVLAERSPLDPVPQPTTDFADYIWPTDAGEIITSTFAEYRRGHFHGGIDISTGNDTGFRVFASRDGSIARIRVSPAGYGKMLFVRHADGYYTTYAHLRNFNDPIEKRVREAQLRDSSYVVDIMCDPLEFPVRKGEVIAYSGETGVGSPHLHFEIRDENLDFVNPMLCDAFREVEDPIAPTVRKIAVRPIGRGTTVNNSWDPVLFNVRQTSPGEYEVREQIHLTGASGFAIDIRDRSPGTYYRQGVYSHDLYIDDTLFYSVRLDRAPSADAHQSGLFYDWQLADAGRGTFQKLYAESPSLFLSYHPRTDSAGLIRTPPVSRGEHQFRIISSDRGGNRAIVTGTLVLSAQPEITVSQSGTNLELHLNSPIPLTALHIAIRSWTKAEWSQLTRKLDGEQVFTIDGTDVDVLKVIAIDGWRRKSPPLIFFLSESSAGRQKLSVSHTLEDGYVRIHVRSEGPIRSRPVLRIYEGPGEREIPLRAVEADHWTAEVVPDETLSGLRRIVAVTEASGTRESAFEEFEIYPFVAGGTGTHFIDDGNLVLSFDSRSVRSTLFVQVGKTITERGTMYACEPSRAVLDKGVIVAMRTNGAGPGSGLFVHSRRGWDLLATNRDGSAAMLNGRMEQTLGEVGIITDSTPPDVSRVRIRGTGGGRPSISFSFGDDFPGIEYQNLIMYIDDAIVIPEIDGEHSRATYQVTEPLSKGSHLLRIHVSDKLGNLTEVTRTFTTG